MRFTEQQIEWLRENHHGLTPKQIARHFRDYCGRQVTADDMRRLLTARGIRKVQKPTLWPDHLVEFVADAYTQMPLEHIPAELERAFGVVRTLQQVRSLTRNRGLKSGRTGQFEKGQSRIPGSGAKGPNRTSFKPGRRPEEARNYMPIGSFRFSKDGYLERKVTDDQSLAPARRWVGVHRLNWEAAHGPIPDGHCVSFIDGDPLNAELDNLVLLSRRELCWLNKTKLGAVPAELRPVAIATAKLQARAREMQNQA